MSRRRWETVLDVYRRPYDAAFPVVCMDETPRQLISATREPVPAAPGRPARDDYEYRRRGSCNVFMATEPLAGRRMTKVTARRTNTDWAHVLNDIAERHPGAQRITLVMDNLNTHRPGALYEAFPPAEAKGPVGPLRVRLHANARQLAQRRRGRAQRQDPSRPPGNARSAVESADQPQDGDPGPDEHARLEQKGAVEVAAGHQIPRFMFGRLPHGVGDGVNLCRREVSAGQRAGYRVSVEHEFMLPRAVRWP